MNRKPLNLGMQFFADGDPTPTPAPAPTPNPTPAPQPGITPPQAAPAQPAAVNVDIEQLTAQASTKAAEAAERKMEAVFKSMLQQNGMDAESINKMTAEWKAKQQTPEQIAAEKDGTITGLTNDNQKLQRQLAAVGKGIPVDKSDKYIALAQSYLGEDGDFSKALDAALVDFPILAPAEPEKAKPHRLIIPPTGDGPIEYTTEQIKNMTPQQINANWDNVKQTLSQKG